MADIHAEVYQNAMKLNHMAAFTWDLRQDIFCYDEMLPNILQHDIPHEGMSEHLMKARLIHPKDRMEFRKQVEWLLHGKNQRTAPEMKFSMKLRIYTVNRCYIWIRLKYLAKFEDSKAYHISGFLQNIHAQQEEQVRMKNMMEHDPMTGLYSKTHSAYLVDQILTQSSLQQALMVIDLDNFKQVNDQLGHLIGDAVIMDIAMNLKMMFRNSDILGHIGGDEFMVLMKDITTVDIVYDRCNQLRDLLRKSYQHETGIVNVSASIGIALAPAHGTDYRTLFSHADAALYQSKRTGKDRQMLYSATFVEKREKEGKINETTQDFRKLLEDPRQYILTMAFNSKDTSLAVQILLEIFAKYFKVDRAYVFWHIDGPFWPRILFEYVMGSNTKASIAHDAQVRRHMRKRYHNTKYGRFSECSDTSKLPGRDAQRVFARRHMCAYLECAVMDGNNCIGSVGFDDCQQPREWNESEHEVLQAFADIMRRFLFGQLYYERMKGQGALEF